MNLTECLLFSLFGNYRNNCYHFHNDIDLFSFSRRIFVFRSNYCPLKQKYKLRCEIVDNVVLERCCN